MKDKANRVMIGGFVVTAIFLLVASVVVFGSGDFFKKTHKSILYFNSSIKGLNIGAPVLFQGVQVGSVSDIVMRLDQEKLEISIPIIIEITSDKFQIMTKSSTHTSYQVILTKLIDKGLRGVLSIQSIITGQLLIELYFYPETEAKFVEVGSKIPEIPTIPSTTARLVQTLQKIDVEGLVKQFSSTLTAINQLVNNPELEMGIHSLKKTIDNSQHLIGEIAPRVDEIIGTIGNTLSEIQSLVRLIQQQVGPISDNAKITLASFDQLSRDTDKHLEKLSNEIEISLKDIGSVVSEDAPLVLQLQDVFYEISSMARAFKQLSNFLEQHPESIIRGKGMDTRGN